MSPATSTATVSWLHLSDLHVRKELGWEQDIVLTSLIRDVEARYKDANRPQVLFVTGDIAFSGREDEYGPAEDFLRKLCASVSISANGVFVVPGNHDVDRGLAEDAFDGARRKLTSTSEVDRFFRSEERRRTIFVRERSFRAFANRVMQPPPTYSETSFAHARVIRLGPIRIRVLLLDSSWLATGGDSDLGTIVLGERQVIDSCSMGDPDSRSLTFALMHHPFSWIADFEQASVENRVIENADMCLRGHLHSEDQRATEAANRRLIVFAAGAAFQTRTSDNCYLWCSLDLSTGRGLKVSHRYNGVKNAWDASEPVEWFLTERPPGPLLPPAADRLIGEYSPEFPGYLKCLLTGVYSEVPVRLPTDEVTFVSVDTSLPGTKNALGTIVNRIKHHFAWEEIWDPEAWKAELNRLAREWDGIVRTFSGAAQSEMLMRQGRAERLLAVVYQESDSSRPPGVATAIYASISAGDVVGARQILDHWRDQGEPEPRERLALLRVEIQVLLGEGNASLAMKKALELTNDPSRTAVDFALSARCALDSGDLPAATQLIHRAIDSGAPLDLVRNLALKIAGLSGDPSLVKKVRA